MQFSDTNNRPKQKIYILQSFLLLRKIFHLIYKYFIDNPFHLQLPSKIILVLLIGQIVVLIPIGRHGTTVFQFKSISQRMDLLLLPSGQQQPTLHTRNIVANIEKLEFAEEANRYVWFPLESRVDGFVHDKPTMRL